MLTESTNKLTYQKLSKEEMEQRGILGRLVGVCADFASPTRNGRKYPEKLWENIFNSDIMKERIANGVCFGELGHPPDREETDMEKICICMPEEPKKGPDGKLRAVFDILDTPNGRILKSLCDYGSTLGISSRGSGDLEVDFDGQESVNPDTYNCEGFDIVLLPGVKDARLQYVTESLDKTRYNKTLRQKLQESVDKETEDHKKAMLESLNTLGIDLDESLSPQEKMDAWHNGTRRENIRACGDDKLLMYRKICADSGYADEVDKIDAELENRGITPPTTGEKLKPIEAKKPTFAFDKEDNLLLILSDEAGENFISKFINIHDLPTMDTFKEKSIPDGNYFVIDSTNPKAQKIAQAVLNFIDDKELGEALREAYFNGYTYKYSVNAVSNDSKKVLGGSKTLEGAEKIGIEQAQHVFESPFMTPQEKYDYLGTMYISDDDNDNIVSTNDFDDYVDGLMSELLGKLYVKEDLESDEIELKHDSKNTEYHLLDKAYDNKLEFKSVDSGELKDIIGYLETHQMDYEIYNHKTDDGCTVFYDGTIDILEDVQSADDNDMAVVNELQEALKLNKILDEKIVSLQEKLSACYAKEMKLEETIDGYKIKTAELSNRNKENLALRKKISKLEEELKASSEEITSRKNTLHETMQRDAKERKFLQESISDKDNTIAKLSKQVDELVNDKNAMQNNVDVINEKLETISKDNKQLKEKYSKKLEQNNKLVEKYKRIAKNAVDKYINKQATILGVTPSEIKNRLPESYTFTDIDEICEGLREYRVNMNSLPFNTSLNENINLAAKNINNRTLVPNNIDDEISDVDLKLAERFMK